MKCCGEIYISLFMFVQVYTDCLGKVSAFNVNALEWG